MMKKVNFMEAFEWMNKGNIATYLNDEWKIVDGDFWKNDDNTGCDADWKSKRLTVHEITGEWQIIPNPLTDSQVKVLKEFAQEIKTNLADRICGEDVDDVLNAFLKERL